MADVTGSLSSERVDAALRSHVRSTSDASAKHDVAIYTSELQLAIRVADFVRDGLDAGDAILIIARPTHWSEVRTILAGRGINPTALSGSVMYMNAHETLSAFMVDGVPDPTRFESVVGQRVTSCLNDLPSHQRLRAYGEMVDVLWQSGFQSAALQLEHLWNLLLQRHDFTLLCAYAADGFVGDLATLDAVGAVQTGITATANDGPASSSENRRRKLEEAHAGEADRADRLLRITTAIADAVSPEEVFAALVDSVAEALGASSSGLWLLDGSAGVARLVRSLGYTGIVQDQLAELRLDTEPGVPILDSIRRNQPLWIDTKAKLLEDYPHLDAITTEGRRYKIACLPLTAEGRVLGALGLTIETEGTLSEEERAFLLVVARYASQALERLRLLIAERSSRDAAQSAARRLQVMARLSRAFVEADLALPARLTVVASELAAALDGCINVTLLESDNRLHFAAVDHPIAEAQAQLRRLTGSRPLTLGEGVTGTIAQTGKSVLLNALTPQEVSTKAPAEYVEFLTQFPPSALIGAPLKVQGRLIGVVTATRVRAGQQFTSDDLSLLEELADRAAVAIENSRLFQETVDARRRADQLYAFAQSVSAATSLEEVYEAALRAIEVASGSDRLAILTCDREGKPRFRAWRSLSEDYRRAVDGHSPWTADTTRFTPVLVSDARNDPAFAQFAELFERERIGALAFFPLVTRGTLLGKFMVYFGEPHEFLRTEVDLATSIANHLASVVSRFTAIQTLEETLEANELFAGVLAHDLRNPLGAIVNSAEVLLMQQEGQAGWSGVAESHPLRRILRSGARMTVLIDQLLDFTRARSGGGIPVKPHRCSLSELVAQAGAELELTHPDWGIRYEARGDANGWWDAARMLQVISNLVANAGEHGTNRTAITVEVDGTSGSEVLLQVRNEGVIPESVRARMFEPFLGASRTHESGGGGLGLGLFIVREIVRSHGGAIAVECTETDTVATVRLPRDLRKVSGSRP